MLAELHWRTIRLMVAFEIGHIGATLVVAVALAAAIEFGWLPVSIARASDVGMSYGALAVLAALTGTLPPRWRPAWIGWRIAAAMTAAIIGGDFTDAGHTVAAILGLPVWTRISLPVQRTPLRLFMLVTRRASVSWSWLTTGGDGCALAIGVLGAGLAYTIAQFNLARSPVAPSPWDGETA